MTISEFRDKFYERTGKYMKLDDIRYLERKGVFKVPRINGNRDFGDMYEYIEDSILHYYFDEWSLGNVMDIMEDV